MSINSKILGLRVAGTIFGIVALLHLLRVVTMIPIMIGTWLMPIWFNVLGLVGATLVCLWLWLLSVSRDK